MLRPYRGNRSIEQNDDVAFLTKGDFLDVRGVFDHAEDADDRRRVNGFAEGFVVEADVAAGDGRVEGGAGLGEAVDGFAELPHHLGLFGAAEIEAIRGGDGPRSAAGHVAGRFCDVMHGSYARIQLAPAAVAVSGQREGALYDSRPWILDAHDGRSSRRGLLECSCARCCRTER